MGESPLVPENARFRAVGCSIVFDEERGRGIRVSCPAVLRTGHKILCSCHGHRRFFFGWQEEICNSPLNPRWVLLIYLGKKRMTDD